MDPHLVSLANAAEEGRDCPRIRVSTTGGDLVLGTPVTSKDFIDLMYPEVVADIENRRRSLPRRERREYRTDPAAVAETELSVLQDGEQEGPPPLTLAYARVWWKTSANGIELPAVRIPLECISLWWVAGGKDFSEKRGGWLIGGGFLLPVDGA